jgi:hypothetical protein
VDSVVSENMKELMTARGCMDEWMDVWVPDGKMDALLDT